MNATSPDDVLEGLTVEQQHQLLDRLSWKLSRSTDPFSEEEEALYDALHEASRWGRRSRQPLSEFISNRGVGGRNGYRDKMRACFDLVDDGCGERLRRGERNALLSMLFGWLAQDLRRRGIPVTPLTLLNNYNSLRNALEERFPGYADAALLHRVVA